MDEYYGSNPASSSFFMHYGVKGMKWGVRKAVATGNQKALDRHFRKAAKKLKKLQDIGLNPKKYAAKAAAYGAAAAGTGTIAAGGLRVFGKKMIYPIDWDNLKKWESKAKLHMFLDKNSKAIRIGSAAATAGLAAASGVNAYRAVRSKKYRQKAVNFRKAMDDAFKGTKYAGQHVAAPRKKNKRRK